MKVAVIGSGAREHCIAATLLKDDHVDEVIVIPGNPGMQEPKLNTISINVNDHDAIAQFLLESHVELTIIGPEAPLIDGIVDTLNAHGLRVFGPSAKAALIEGSKDHAKRFMDAHHIPTAQYCTFDNLESAVQYVRDHGAPIVVKADGLAAGKGVTVAFSMQDAEQALHDIFVDHRFGGAGSRVVIEDYLVGEEFSLMSFVAGKRFWTMPISQDHKRAYDGDLGPNTGGMGAYSPVPHISNEVVSQAVERIVKPTVEGLFDDGTPFTGVLYAGLIATEDGPKVIEFNARFGDPETQVVLPQLSSRLAQGLVALCDGGEPLFTWQDNQAALAVVIASEGYPHDLVTGYRVAVPDDPTIHAYYAGVKHDEHGDLVSSSGRVVVLQTQGPDVAAAQTALYKHIDQLPLEHLFYRHDIGNKAL